METMTFTSGTMLERHGNFFVKTWQLLQLWQTNSLFGHQAFIAQQGVCFKKHPQKGPIIPVFTWYDVTISVHLLPRDGIKNNIDSVNM